MITKKQYEIMLPYEQHFFTALNCGYARNVTMEGLAILNDVYREIFHRDGGLVNGCNACRLRGLKDLAAQFYEYQASKELEIKTQNADNQGDNKKRVTNKSQNKVKK